MTEISTSPNAMPAPSMVGLAAFPLTPADVAGSVRSGDMAKLVARLIGTDSSCVCRARGITTWWCRSSPVGRIMMSSMGLRSSALRPSG
ncbi:MAG: hypothetical protein AAF141_11045, partial [Pseudomonadota bacterium]